MINVSKIQTSLIGIVGFSQPYNPDFAIVDTENQSSTSGYFVTENPYAKIEFIKECQDYIDISDADFNEFLKNLQKTAIINVCNKVFNDSDILGRGNTFTYNYLKNELDSLPVGFVGYRIITNHACDFGFKINKVSLDFEGNGDIKLLMFKSNKKDAIFEKEITIDSDHKEEVLNWSIEEKGEYYIGYIADSLTVEPYKQEEETRLVNGICGLDIDKIKVENHTAEQLFNIKNIEGLNSSIGLDFDILTYHDYTSFVINNQMIFARAIQIECIIQCVQIYLSSLRSNANSTMAEQLYQKLIVELEGTSNESAIKVVGLKKQLLGEIANIKSEVQKIKDGMFGVEGIEVYTLT